MVQVADSTHIRAIGQVPTTLIRAVGVTATTVSFSTNSNKYILTSDTLLDVNNNPGAFANAYWEVNSLRIYTPL